MIVVGFVVFPDQLTTPEAAIALGLTRYFTGLRCRNGHIAPRRVKDGYCIACKCAAEKRRVARRDVENFIYYPKDGASI